MSIGDIKLNVVFFKAGSGTEPVRKWLKSLSGAHKKAIGEDIKTVQFGWPLGMPLVEKLEPYLWEVSSLFAKCSTKRLKQFYAVKL